MALQKRILSCDSSDCELELHYSERWTGDPSPIACRYGINLRDSEDPRAMLRLQASCEAAKIQLSESNEARLQIDFLWPGQPSWQGRISRQEFELINESYFRQCLRQTTKSMKDAHLDVDNVDDVVLVGGSTRIPKVNSFLLLTTSCCFATTSRRQLVDEEVAKTCL